MIQHELPSGVIWEGDWMEAPLQGGYSMAEVDGPFGMKKAAWDRMNIDGLADWYTPHIARLTSLMLPSSTVYLWNTAEGWARLDPVMRGLGWEFNGLLFWYKTNCQAQKATEAPRGWPDMTEVCGMYTRGPNEMDMWNEWGETHPVRVWMDAERRKSGLSIKDVDRMIGVSDMARHWFTWSQWCLPSEERYKQLQSIIPGLDRSLADMKAQHAVLWAEYRLKLESVRPPFQLPTGVQNVWSCPIVSRPERLDGPDGQALHPCQKPLLFAERMVQASTRPGDRILVPFGGTCRIATYLERLRRMEPENARYHDTCELNQDGKDYLGAVLGRMGEDTGKAGQMALFGAR